MGSELNLRMEGFLRQQILDTTDIFLPVTDETARFKVGRRSFFIKTGDEESSIRIVKEDDRTTALFTYPIDIDSDPKNGRLYLEDRFVFDPRERKLISVERSFRGGSGEGMVPWEDFLKRLRRQGLDLNPKDEAVKKFFERVVLRLPDPCLEAGCGEKPPSSAKITKVPPFPPSFRKLPGPAGLLESAEPRSRVRSGADRIDQVIRQFIEQLFSPSMVVSLFMGAAAFRLAERGVLLQKGMELRPLLLATGAGLMAEAPAFEIAHRVLNGAFGKAEDPGDFLEGVFRNLFTFGALHGAGLGVRLTLRRLPASSLPFGEATFPIFHHTASFASLHGLHEIERTLSSHVNDDTWTTRLMEDGVFYFQAVLAGHLAQVATDLIVNPAETHPLKSRLVGATARIEELEGQLRRLRESVERVLENAEIQEREDVFLKSSLQEALRRAKMFQERVEALEERLKKNKKGTEKVIEWARLKEKENESLQASLLDALRELEKLSEEKDRLAVDLKEMKAEYVKRDQEATAAERRLEELLAELETTQEPIPPQNNRVSEIRGILEKEPDSKEDPGKAQP